MQNALCEASRRIRGPLTKTLRVMQITAVFLLGICLQVAAKGVSQTITFSGKDVPMEKVLLEVEKQSGFFVSYSTKQIRSVKPVTITVKDLPLTQFLEATFRDQPLEYAIKENTIFVRKKPGFTTADLSRQIPFATMPPPITGIVRGPDGQPLAGVNIVVKGTKKGVSTAANGSFSIEANANDILVISSIGYGTKEITIDGNNTILIGLALSTNPLDEVQIIAYGTTSQRLSTGNVSTVKAVDIQTQPVNNPLMAIQGRVPGVYIEQSTGNSGGSVQVRIQGQNSIVNGSEPFYVIDGVPFNSSNPAYLSSIIGFNGGSALSLINPADIESIEVLKDADATAIYGSKAANGAILITTKKGVAGKTSVSVNTQTGIGKITRKLKLLNTKEYLDLRKEAYFINDKFTTSSPNYHLQYDINGTWDTSKNTDWQDKLIGGTSRYSDLQAMISGGSKGTQFKFGAGYHKETTVYPGDDFSDTKGSISYNINHTSANEKFTFQLSGSYLHDQNKLPYVDVTGAAIKLPPNAPDLYTDDGRINWAPLPNGKTTFIDNPIAVLSNAYRIKTDNLLANVQVSYEIVPGLNLKSSFGFNKLETDEFRTMPIIAINPNVINKIRLAMYGGSNSQNWIIEPQVTYNTENKYGKFNLLIGSTFQRNNLKGNSFTGTGYSTDAELPNMMAAANLTITNNVITDYSYSALFGRISYNLRDKYLLNVTGRRDGSSRFGAQNLFHNFYSLGGAWIFSSENWASQNLDFLNFGKLRVSFGTTGSDQIGDYQYLNLYTQVYADLPYMGSTGIEALGHASPYIQWEETKKLNIGMDLTMFNNRLQLTANYFRNRSSNQLLAYPLSVVTGFNSVYRNIPAKVQNSGLELVLKGDIINGKNFKWNSSINITLPSNKLISFPDLVDYPSYADQLIIGAPITLIRAYKSAGVNSQTGVYQFYDADNKITSSPNTTTDKTTWVDLTPKLYGGWQNQFQYKGFYVDFLFQFVKQVGPNGKAGTIPGTATNQPVSVLERWKNPGDNEPVQRANSTGAYFRQESAFRNSDAAYSDASFIRLKNVSVSYNFSSALLQKAKITQARVYILAQNLLTFTNYLGMDPETRNFAFLPPLRILSIGTQITF